MGAMAIKNFDEQARKSEMEFAIAELLKQVHGKYVDV